MCYSIMMVILHGKPIDLCITSDTFDQNIMLLKNHMPVQAGFLYVPDIGTYKKPACTGMNCISIRIRYGLPMGREFSSAG